MYSLELLMMEGKTVQNMESDIQYTRKIVHLVGFTIEIEIPPFLLAQWWRLGIHWMIPL